MRRLAAAERFPYPLAEGGRIAADVDRDVEDLSAETTNELSLGLLDLVMQTAYHVLMGEGLIVLNEGSQNTESRQNPLIIAFEKEPTAVFEDPGFKELHIRNLGRYRLHPLTSFVSVMLANTWSSCCCQPASRKAKVLANLSLASTELAGRLAGVG